MTVHITAQVSAGYPDIILVTTDPGGAAAVETRTLDKPLDTIERILEIARVFGGRQAGVRARITLNGDKAPVYSDLLLAARRDRWDYTVSSNPEPAKPDHNTIEVTQNGKIESKPSDIDRAASNLLVDLCFATGIIRRHLREIHLTPGMFRYRYDEAYGNAVGAFGGNGTWDYGNEADKVRAALWLFAAGVGVPIGDLTSVRLDLATPGHSIVSWRRKATKGDPGYVVGNKVDHRSEFRFVGETA